MTSLTPLTPQQAYEQIRAYFTRPGAVLAFEEVMLDEPVIRCRYRTPEGNKCAAGCLIPDEMYQPAMEDKSLSALRDRWPDIATLFPEETYCFVAMAQEKHDLIAMGELWLVGDDAAAFVGELDKLARTAIGDGIYGA